MNSHIGLFLINSLLLGSGSWLKFSMGDTKFEHNSQVKSLYKWDEPYLRLGMVIREGLGELLH